MEHATILSVEYTTLHVQINRGILDLIIAHVAVVNGELIENHDFLLPSLSDLPLTSTHVQLR